MEVENLLVDGLYSMLSEIQKFGYSASGWGKEPVRKHKLLKCDTKMMVQNMTEMS